MPMNAQVDASTWLQFTPFVHTLTALAAKKVSVRWLRRKDVDVWVSFWLLGPQQF